MLLFFMGKIYGYEIATLYDQKDNSFSNLGIKKYIEFRDSKGHFALGFNHYNFLKTYQLGADYINHSLFGLVPVQAD